MRAIASGVYLQMNILRDRRKELGMSLRQAAARAKVSAAYLSDLERGNRKWPKGHLIGSEKTKSRIAAAYLLVQASANIPCQMCGGTGTARVSCLVRPSRSVKSCSHAGPFIINGICTHDDCCLAERKAGRGK